MSLLGLVAVFVYWKFYVAVMPQLVQTTALNLYSEPGCKEGVVEIGENVVLEEFKYNFIVSVTVPEIESNSNVSGINVELWADQLLLGKGYKNIKKYEGLASTVRKTIESIGIIATGSENVQIINANIFAAFNHSYKTLKFKIFPEELQIQEVKVQFEVKLSGYKYYLYEYFSTCFVIGILTILILQVSILSKIK